MQADGGRTSNELLRKGDFANHHQSLSLCCSPPFSVKTKFEHKAGKKWSYVRRQFLSEIGLSQWRSREFWAVLLMFAIVFWIRIYMHYIGQWIFLTALLIPINK